ncbi:MAG: hypothetical protein DRQ57_14615 [Gammaproteobacteria bacterium]|nr:MAG: hypothetical protein DRQ57_14615 [Gammaproteobacteria bacterium]
MERRKMTLLLMLTIFSIFLIDCSGSDMPLDTPVEFVDIPGNGVDIKHFKMSKTEITNQQYVNFLNSALRANKITVGQVEPLNQSLSKPKTSNRLMKQMRLYKSKNQQLVYDENGNRILDLLNIRTIGDHDHDGVVELWEMKNPLNRCMIEYDKDSKIFKVVNPKEVDWNIYFDNDNLPDGIEAVDSITNWAELHEFWPEEVSFERRQQVTFDKGDYNKDVLFVGIHDLDFELPSHEEVKKWPVIFIEYYSAKAFADFYEFDLPTSKEVQWAGAAGMGYKYGTNDGTITTKNVIYNDHSVANDYTRLARGGLDHTTWPGQHKGHVQPVASCPPNSYGVYDLSGNVIEWTKSKNSPELNCPVKVSSDFETRITIGGGWTYPKEYLSLSKRCFTESNIAATNDHFGFRVIRR